MHTGNDWHTGPSASRSSSWRWRRSGRLRVHRRHLRRHQALYVGAGYLQRQQMLPLRCANRPLRCNQSPKFDVLLGGRWKHRACFSPPHSVTRAVICRFPGYNCCYGGVVTCEAWMNGPKTAMYAYPDESVRNDGSTFDTMIQVCCLPVCGCGCAPACVSVSARARVSAAWLLRMTQCTLIQGACHCAESNREIQHDRRLAACSAQRADGGPGHVHF